MGNEIIPQNETINQNRTIKNHAITNGHIGINNKLNNEEKNRFIHEFIAEIFSKLESKESLIETQELRSENNEVTPLVTQEMSKHEKIENEEKVEADNGIIVVDRFEGHLAVCENRETRRNAKHRNIKIASKCSRRRRIKI